MLKRWSRLAKEAWVLQMQLRLNSVNSNLLLKIPKPYSIMTVKRTILSLLNHWKLPRLCLRSSMFLANLVETHHLLQTMLYFLSQLWLRSWTLHNPKCHQTTLKIHRNRMSKAKQFRSIRKTLSDTRKKRITKNNWLKITIKRIWISEQSLFFYYFPKFILS